ncbi:hypothetical protein KPH14_002760 [Odynerus spinipes]|uniref:Deltamethrin resistance protein prag01 domain-containing protein n=1 Tax=Odynerus spinipes TaxID=1348599 RepID=A0AAD9RM75_9HYME|nr:hypothetical protein KPH14_002760 [Odynerus spinipes]
MFRNVVRSVVQNVPRTGNRSYAIYGPANYKPPSMDDLPLPEGSWQEAYEKKQRTYNMHLIGGILFTVGTLIAAKTSGLFFLNFSPPTRKEQK